MRHYLYLLDGIISSKIQVVWDTNNISAEEVKSIAASAVSKKSIVIPTDEIAVGKNKDGIQYVSIDIKDNKFSPSVEVLQDNIEQVDY
jgi:type III secretory pathway lipoprotein EscJ